MRCLPTCKVDCSVSTMLASILRAVSSCMCHTLRGCRACAAGHHQGAGGAPADEHHGAGERVHGVPVRAGHAAALPVRIDLRPACCALAWRRRWSCRSWRSTSCRRARGRAPAPARPTRVCNPMIHDAAVYCTCLRSQIPRREAATPSQLPCLVQHELQNGHANAGQPRACKAHLQSVAHPGSVTAPACTIKVSSPRPMVPAYTGLRRAARQPARRRSARPRPPPGPPPRAPPQGPLQEPPQEVDSRRAQLRHHRVERGHRQRGAGCSGAPAGGRGGGGRRRRRRRRDSAAKVERLVGLGFSRRQCEEMLAACGGDEERAASLLSMTPPAFERARAPPRAGAMSRRQRP